MAGPPPDAAPPPPDPSAGRRPPRRRRTTKSKLPSPEPNGTDLAGPARFSANRSDGVPTTPAGVALPTPAELVCEYCRRRFADHQRLFAHPCEPRRRFQARDDKSTRIGFQAFKMFYRQLGRRPPDWAAFERAKLYSGFVAFGRWMLDNQTINPPGYIDFVLRLECKLDEWTKPSIYASYVRETIKSESPEAALERNIMLLQQWAMESGHPWNGFFRLVSPAQAVLWIQSGRLSPWLILLSRHAQALLTRLSPEQTNVVNGAIDAEFWRLKLQHHAEAVTWLRKELAAYDV